MANIFRTVENLDLPDGEYAVISSGILQALGLRAANDVDIVVSPQILKQFKDKGGWRSYEKWGKTFLENEEMDIDMFSEISWEAYPTTRKEVIASARDINGVPFMNIAETIKFKRAMGREKDERDTALLKRIRPKNEDKIVYTEIMEWEGDTYISELVDAIDFDALSPTTQVQAVCFHSNKVVVYEDTDGNYGLPGGTIEAGESFEDALRREIREENAAEVTAFEPLLYLRTYKKGEPEDVSFQVRYVAEVELLDTPINDPDGKAVRRSVCSPDKALDLLAWGKKAEIYIQKAHEKR